MERKDKGGRELFKARLQKALEQTSLEFYRENQVTFAVDRTWDGNVSKGKAGDVPGQQILKGSFGTTHRKSGQVVPAGKTRNIIDLNKLGYSQTVTRIARYRLRHTWSENYAAAVYAGYIDKKGRVIPGRPWIKVTLRRVDLGKVFVKEYKQT